ncbi:MAG: DUF3667 domain-containing protein [Xanthomonadales bacterium]|nr:DUF3667 domain-containing protein [Xanthomonadales bacterium]
MSPQPPDPPAHAQLSVAHHDVAASSPNAALVRCGNCGAVLHGAYCHQCGQAAKSPLRHLSGLIEDALDTVFNFDGRFVHTLPALFFRPGFLSIEYFGGHRARYIAPFRLMFLLCLMAFFVTQLELDHGSKPILVNTEAGAQINAQLDRQLDHWRQAAKVAAVSGAASSTPATAVSTASPAAAASTPMPSDDTPLPGHFPSSARLDPHRHPMAIKSLPPIANQALNDFAIRVYDNIKSLSGNNGPAARSEATQRVLAEVFSVLPQTLLVLLPLFALLLKIVYLFKRRLYVEHLIVALHSHAFLFLSLLLLALLALADQFAIHHAQLKAALSWISIAMLWWMPVYLFMAQKRIYRQGWIMTTLKFGIVGVSYLVLVSSGLVFAALIGLASA